MQVVKRNKRLMIVDSDGVCLYTPPDFLRHLIQNRSPLEWIVTAVSGGTPLIDAVMHVETQVMERSRKRREAAESIIRRYPEVMKALGPE